MRIVLNTFGSFGDIHPYMAIALELQSRGHVPVIATMEGYREKIENAGLQFAPVRPNIPPPQDQDNDIIERIMEPKTGGRFLMDEIIFPAVRESYDDLIVAVAGADLLVTHPAAPAGPLLGRTLGMPWISTILAPLSFFSAYDFPVPPIWQWTHKLTLLGPRFLNFFFEKVKNSYKAQPVVDFRNELGLGDYGHPMFEGQHSPAMVLALFSRIFGRPQPDWPPQTEVTGFCFYDGHHQCPMPVELARFLDDGPPPILFTLGSSAVWVARDFFAQSIEAARRLGQRAILLVGDERNLPDSLPAGMIAAALAPYETLMPRASVVVHHGGIGTTAQGLLSGAPALIVPFAFDQSDNAEHARRLGTSRTVYRKSYRAPRVTNELRKLLEQPHYRENARAVRQQLKQENGAARAADLIEQVLGTTRAAEEELAYVTGD